ncbi:MAG: tRNA (N6-threonylcarbamoyladenosine(37)-N6)-methyltransferase TrmO [Candidatus Sabulitectum sp.]|nr:tRNA (N6-threonylcarbamoyladenosine(37)-N6)-methyltransferase TrmO [Candidatus Sabulitectum sp.]
MQIIYNSIGVIHTPYIEMAPFQAVEDDTNGPFVLEVDELYATGLKDLEKHKYVIVFFHIDRAKGYNGSNMAHPPSMNGGSIGLFASRSPNRPNTIGIDVAELLKIEGNKVYTSGLSALEGTPLLDIKPYLDVDSKKLD